MRGCTSIHQHRHTHTHTLCMRREENKGKVYRPCPFTYSSIFTSLIWMNESYVEFQHSSFTNWFFVCLFVSTSNSQIQIYVQICWWWINSYSERINCKCLERKSQKLCSTEPEVGSNPVLIVLRNEQSYNTLFNFRFRVVIILFFLTEWFYQYNTWLNLWFHFLIFAIFDFIKCKIIFFSTPCKHNRQET